jgi:hypothetical protein
MGHWLFDSTNPAAHHHDDARVADRTTPNASPAKKGLVTLALGTTSRGLNDVPCAVFQHLGVLPVQSMPACILTQVVYRAATLLQVGPVQASCVLLFCFCIITGIAVQNKKNVRISHQFYDSHNSIVHPSCPLPTRTVCWGATVSLGGTLFNTCKSVDILAQALHETSSTSRTRMR